MSHPHQGLIDALEAIEYVAENFITDNGMKSIHELAGVALSAVYRLPAGPSYHSLRLAERFQRDAESFAEGARTYRDLVMTSRVSTMSRALNLRLYREYAAKAADMARRARVLMGIDE